jgi:hypothetical protein
VPIGATVEYQTRPRHTILALSLRTALREDGKKPAKIASRFTHGFVPSVPLRIQSDLGCIPPRFAWLFLQISPAVSSKPHHKFMICTAWPLAPFTRLSSAEVMMKLFVRGS